MKNKKKGTVVRSFLAPTVVDIESLKGVNEPTELIKAKASIKVVPPRIISEGRGRYASRYAVVVA